MNLYRKLRNIAWRASMKGLPRGPHLSRYFMYNRLGEVGRTLPNRNGRVLAVSRSANVCEMLGLTPSEIVPADYPEHNMLSLKFPDESFDYVISDQVLEHVEGPPQDAIDECRRVLKPGGAIRLVAPDLEGIVRAYLSCLEAVRRGEGDAADKYEWIIIELLDQMLRHRSGGEMLNDVGRIDSATAAVG